MADPTPSTCPRCGSPLSDAAASGLCPRCLLAMNLRTRTMPTGESTPSAPPPSPAELEEKFPQFEILECLGRGGMGVVYKARQKALDRVVAIKILAGEWQDEPGFAERFEKEAKLLAKLNHPNIVTIHDFGNAGGLFYIMMEYVDGVNVRDLLREGKLESEQALAIVPPICDALQFAHDHSVVHRDIKPENILLDREGRVKIADFGIATIAGDAADRAGTPAYMAPEQARHEAAIDHRADIYALGAVLYEMLTGERPSGDGVPPSQRVEIDVRLDEIVLRSLAAKPQQRFQQASEVKGLVTRVIHTPPPAVAEEAPAKPSVPWGVFLVPGAWMLLVVTVFGFWDAAYLNREEVPYYVSVVARRGGSLGFVAIFTVIAWLRFRRLGNFDGEFSRSWRQRRVAALAGLCVALGLLFTSLSFIGIGMMDPWSRTTLRILALLPPVLWIAGLVLGIFARRSFEGKWALTSLLFFVAHSLVFTGINAVRREWYPPAFHVARKLPDANSFSQMMGPPGRELAIDLESGMATTYHWAPVSFKQRISEQGADLYYNGGFWYGLDLEVAEGKGKPFDLIGSEDLHVATWESRPGFWGFSSTSGIWAFRTRDGIRGVLELGPDYNPTMIRWRVLDRGRSPGPVEEQRQQKAAAPVRIRVGADGGISLGGRPLAGERLAEELSRLSAANPARPVMIEADTTAPYTAVSAVLDLCKRASLLNVSFFTLTTPDEEEVPLPKVEPDPGMELILPEGRDFDR